ncbi:hypothetical protein OF83DRAFT_1172068 [Amylostereum chailletii]|nr:hypothetical protein OF83DRAFT_1172068 [Amylostereum chailletii]
MQTATHGKKYTGMPFDYSNRRTFAIKYLSFVGLGLALPFVAVNYQLWKGGAFNKTK